MPSKPAALSKKSKRSSPQPKAAPAPESDEHTSERRGLSIFLQQTRAFRLALALYNDPVARDAEISSLRDELDAQGVRVLTLDLREPSGDVRTLLARVEDLVKNVASPSERVAVMVINLETCVDYSPELATPDGPSTAFLATANLHRELFPEVCLGPLVIWMTELLERAFVSQAPDLWHWRSHVFDLRTRVVPSEAIVSADQKAWSSDDFRRHPEDRLRRLEEELVAYRRAGMSYDECRVLNAIGLARLDAGDASRALRDFEQALVIANKIGSRAARGAALGNLGIAYSDLGETRKAIDFYERQLVIVREINDRQGEGNALGNLGIAYKNLGETHKAIGFYEQALVIDRELGDRRGEGADLGNLGNAYATLGETRKAIDFYEQRLAIAREIGDRRGESNAVGNLGIAYKNLGETHKAIGFYEQALVIDRELGDRRGEGASLGNLGIVYATLGETRKAIEFCERQLTIAREIGDRRGEGNALWNSAAALWRLDERNEAIERGAAAAAIFEATEHSFTDTARTLLARWRSEAS